MDKYCQRPSSKKDKKIRKIKGRIIDGRKKMKHKK